jgi:hypothetical protein
LKGGWHARFSASTCRDSMIPKIPAPIQACPRLGVGEYRVSEKVVLAVTVGHFLEKRSSLGCGGNDVRDRAIK